LNFHNIIYLYMLKYFEGTIKNDRVKKTFHLLI
jgi:hypothetical protein